MKGKVKIKEILSRKRRKNLVSHYRKRYINKGRRNG